MEKNPHKQPLANNVRIHASFTYERFHTFKLESQIPILLKLSCQTYSFIASSFSFTSTISFWILLEAPIPNHYERKADVRSSTLDHIHFHIAIIGGL